MDKCLTHHLLCSLLVLTLLVSSCQKNEEHKRPNILFIMADDHTTQATGLYGGILEDYAPTLNIKRLATEGAVLNNVFCVNSICSPSRATILTGRYSHINQVYTLQDSLPPGTYTIANTLKENGYETAIIGKWHLKTRPEGFDHYNVLSNQGRYNDPQLIKTNANEFETYQGFSSDVITDLCLDWLANRDKNKPFMMMCQFKAPHEPFDYADRFERLFEDETIPSPNSLFQSREESNRVYDGQQLEILGNRYLDVSVGKPGFPYPGLPFEAAAESDSFRYEVYQKFIKDYLRSVATIDENVGRLLTFLDENNLTQNTVVIYTSDQGYFLGEHGFFDKRIMYEEPLKMPFIIRYPGKIESGSRFDNFVLNTDFAPLISDFAAIRPNTSYQGVSFMPVLLGEETGFERTQFYYRYWLHRDERPAHLGIRTEKYKLIYFYGESLGMTGAHETKTTPAWEFYDLEKDPGENKNEYNNPDYASIIDDLKKCLKEEKQKVGDTDSIF